MPTTHTMRYYQDQENKVFRTIPGMDALLRNPALEALGTIGQPIAPLIVA